MKVTKSTIEPKFSPITVSLEFNSQKEWDTFKAMIGGISPAKYKDALERSVSDKIPEIKDINFILTAIYKEL